MAIGDEVIYKDEVYSVVYVYRNGYMEIRKMNSLRVELATPEEVMPVN